MRRTFLVVAAVLLPSVLAFVSSASAQEAADTETTAQEQFRNAYALLSRADQARDDQHFSLAIELYRRALEAYVAFAGQYPEWEPGVVRFRSMYCDNQLKALLENVRSGRIKLREHAPPPAVLPDAATNATDLSAAMPVPEAVARAKQLLAAQEAVRARRILLDALRKEPDNVVIRLLIGIAQCAARRFDDAVFLLENLVDEHPENAQARVVLGTAYFGSGRTEDAVAALKKALELHPSSGEAHFNLAQIALRREPPDLETARHHYSKALELGVTPDRSTDSILQ